MGTEPRPSIGRGSRPRRVYLHNGTCICFPAKFQCRLVDIEFDYRCVDFLPKKPQDRFENMEDVDCRSPLEKRYA